jgi:hypothetical protein
VTAVLDDHLLRDLLADDVAPALASVLRRHEPATTNLYLFRLCRSLVASTGGPLTRSWTSEQRRRLAAELTTVPPEVRVVPMVDLSHRMAELATDHRVSTLGAEALAAAEHVGGVLCVWAGDDGPQIRAAAASLRLRYRTVTR